MRAIRKNIAWIMLIMLFAVGCSSIEKAESLYRQGEKQEALEMAISLLDDDSPKVRLRAVKLVGSIGGSQAGPACGPPIDPTSFTALSRTFGLSSSSKEIAISSASCFSPWR